MSSFYINFIDESVTASAHVVDGVKYTSTWPTIIPGYSYELKQLGYSNDDGDNWQMSCNARGTPGYSPITNCQTTCTDNGCQMNGDTGGKCNHGTNGICTCSHTYYADSIFCKTIPPPGW